jgi:hypothetical protein
MSTPGEPMTISHGHVAPLCHSVCVSHAMPAIITA